MHGNLYTKISETYPDVEFWCKGQPQVWCAGDAHPKTKMNKGVIFWVETDVIVSKKTLSIVKRVSGLGNLSVPVRWLYRLRTTWSPD